MRVTAEEYLDRTALDQLQGERLRALLTAILPGNRFYARKLQAIRDPRSLARDRLQQLPFTTKAELLADQAEHPPFGTVLTYPIEQYSRFHQTSGTSGRPLRWLDTLASWNWLLDGWEIMYRIAGVKAGDRLLFAFSFGPFLGFWTAFEAATRLGFLCLPGGGMTSTARLRFLLDNEATIVLCTPTYALHLADVAQREGMDLAGSKVRALITAGEPGASIPATRQRIESAWGARLLDHNGLTEVGAVGMECLENPCGIHILETSYIAEIIDPATDQPVAPGETGELVLTNLGRCGSPLIRYRTGDLVRSDSKPCPCGRTFLRLQGGILGRVDDMIYIRGNNLYPTALEALVRRFPEVAEYRVEVDRTGPLTELRIDIEPISNAANGVADRVEKAIRDELLFRAEVRQVPPGTLPRFEMKARRVIIKV